MFHATYEIASAFENEDIRFSTEQNDNNSRIVAGVSGDYCRYDVEFISCDDDNDVSVRVYELLKFPEEMLVPVLRTANECNSRYKYLKFVVNKERRAVNVHYDLPVSTDQPGECSVEAFHLIMRIVDEAYPRFMRVIWGNAYTGADTDLDHIIKFHEE